MLSTLLFLSLQQNNNTLTREEAREGWKLLFDGNSTSGWHNFRGKGVNKGWVVKDGVLSIVDPEAAGDIVTDAHFSWFELSVDFRVQSGMNSGIMFRVSEESEASWHSGPEVQIYDHAPEPGIETSGFLYQLYTSRVDASKPAGEWNTVRILVAPRGCATWLNGVKYYEYNYGDKDFWHRVSQSKFAKYPEFAKSPAGSIALQGDHGNVSFRNIKIRPIKPDPGSPSPLER